MFLHVVSSLPYLPYPTVNHPPPPPPTTKTQQPCQVVHRFYQFYSSLCYHVYNILHICYRYPEMWRSTLFNYFNLSPLDLFITYPFLPPIIQCFTMIVTYSTSYCLPYFSTLFYNKYFILLCFASPSCE